MRKVTICFIMVTTFVTACEDPKSSGRTTMPAGFVYLDEAVPGLVVDLRYYTSNNFVGAPVDGYLQPRPILSRPAAMALNGVQKALQPLGLSLKVFDAYRPQRAVNHFVRWGTDLADRKTKAVYYPDVAKENLFKEGYIAAQSSHSRGSTVDLTLVYRNASGGNQELDMGSPFDYFGPISWPTSLQVTPQQRANRLLLRSLMVAHGFAPYAQEWWHFTLRSEPYPDTYFNFPVRGPP
jgi:zinc D-Ala-D-Ala dipeptidase